MIYGRLCFNVFLVEKNAPLKYAETIKTNVLCHIFLQKIVPLLGNYKKDGRSRDTKQIAVYLNKLWCHRDDRRMV
jgi:hypothetical protein